MSPLREWTDQSVLVTGGAGFIGAHLVDALVSRGACVTVMDCVDRPGRLAHLEGRIHYVTADLADPRWGAESRDPFAYVFHLAAYSKLTAAQEEPEIAYRQNVIGTASLLQLARRWGVKKFVFTSAGGLYTNIPKYLPIDERHPIDPGQGVYVMTKRIGELLCDDFRLQFGLPTLYVRLFNTYGPGQSADFLIPTLIKQGLEAGKITIRNTRVKRDFTFVRDMVAALIKGAESDFCGGPLNLGTGVEHSLVALAEQIAALVGAEVECLNQPTFGPERQLCDSRLAQQTLGWRPATTFEDGVRMTVDTFRLDRAVAVA